MRSRQLGPRDENAAARTAAGLLALGGFATVVTELAGLVVQDRPVRPAVGLAALGLVLLGVVVWRLRRRLPQTLWLWTAVLLVGMIFALDLYTEDAGGGAQIAFLFPVVYAGAFLRTAAAWTVAGVAAVGHGLLVLLLLPVEVAVADSVFAMVAIGALTWVLTWSGRRQDALVERLQVVASVDGLTGLVNRREFEHVAGRTLVEAADVQALAALAGADLHARGAVGTGLLVADIDLFKEVNDAHGHPAGDAALVHAASVIRAAVRPGDTVARIGGDELAVLLPGVGVDTVVERAEALRRAVRDSPLRWDGTEIQVTISVGVAHTALGVDDLEALYSAADAAMYEAKREGRNRVTLAS